MKSSRSKEDKTKIVKGTNYHGYNSYDQVNLNMPTAGLVYEENDGIIGQSSRSSKTNSNSPQRNLNFLLVGKKIKPENVDQYMLNAKKELDRLGIQL